MCSRCASSGPWAGLTVTFWPWQTGAGLLMQDASPLEPHWLMIPDSTLRWMVVGIHLLTRLDEEKRLPLETNLWKIANSSYNHRGRNYLNVDMIKERIQKRLNRLTLTSFSEVNFPKEEKLSPMWHLHNNVYTYIYIYVSYWTRLRNHYAMWTILEMRK